MVGCAKLLGKLSVSGRPRLIGCFGLNGPLRQYFSLYRAGGWSGGAMVLGKLPVLGRPTIWITVGQGLTALAVCAGCLDIFTFIYLFFPLSPSLLGPDID